MNEREAQEAAARFRASGWDVTARPRPISAGSASSTEGTATMRWELAGQSSPPGGLCVGFTTRDMHLLVGHRMIARIK